MREKIDGLDEKIWRLEAYIREHVYYFSNGEEFITNKIVKEALEEKVEALKAERNNLIRGFR